MRYLWKVSALALLMHVAMCLIMIDQWGEYAFSSVFLTLLSVFTVVVMFDIFASGVLGTLAAVVTVIIVTALTFGLFLVGGSAFAVFDIGVNGLSAGDAFARAFTPAVVDRAFATATATGSVAAVIAFAIVGALTGGAFNYEEAKGPFWARFICALPFGVGAVLGLPLVLSRVGRSTVAQPA